MARSAKAEPARRIELSDRQREVLALIAKGRTNGEIAEQLGISLDGVKWHVREILGKLGVDSREDAAAWWRARNRGLRGLGGLAGGAITGVGLKWLGAAATVAVIGVGAVAFWAAIRGTDSTPHTRPRRPPSAPPSRPRSRRPTSHAPGSSRPASRLPHRPPAARRRSSRASPSAASRSSATATCGYRHRCRGLRRRRSR